MKERVTVKDVSGRSRAARTVRTWRGRAPRRRHREERRLDLRLLAPVAVAWVVAAFAGLLVDLRLVWAGSVLALALAVLLIVPSPAASGRRVGRARGPRRLVALTLALTSLLLLTCAAQRTIRTVGSDRRPGPVAGRGEADRDAHCRSAAGDREHLARRAARRRAHPGRHRRRSGCAHRGADAGARPRTGPDVGRARVERRASSSRPGSLRPSRATTSWRSRGRSVLHG